MSKSIILETLMEATPASVNSAIIMTDATELHGNLDYRVAKQIFATKGDCQLFVATVKPLFEALWVKKFNQLPGE